MTDEKERQDELDDELDSSEQTEPELDSDDDSDDDDSDDDDSDDDESDDDESDDDDSDDDESDDDDSDDDDSDDDDSDDDDSDDDDSDDDDSDDDDSDDDDSDDDDRATGRRGATSDERALRVAEALGVGEEELEEAAGDDEKTVPKNRAERRRQKALERRVGRQGKRADAEEVAKLPAKDRNSRLRAELLKKRQQAAKKATDTGLTSAEMVDDALARGGAATVTWLKKNAKTLGWVALVLVLGISGGVWYYYHSEQNTEAAADLLAKGVSAEQGTVIAPDEDKRTDEEKTHEFRVIFASVAEQQEQALKSYAEVMERHSGTGPAILAKLGQAGVHLDRQEYDKAIELYSAVLDTQLVAADEDVKGRVLEGIGFAKESKGDVDGALASFDKLADLDITSFKILAKYHRGRILLDKGEKDKAKEILLKAKDDVEKANLAKDRSATTYRWLEQMVFEVLRRIDPTLAPKTGVQDPEQLRRLQEMLRQQGIDPSKLNLNK